MIDETNSRRRRLRTFGLFAPRVCSGAVLDNATVSEIYIALKAVGFRETCWQFIYQGQRAGLVLPYNDGRNEVHIRFYDDRIFAEFEVGRASIAHFLGPFLNANSFILDTLRGSISEQAFDLAKGMMSPGRLYEQERALDEWEHRSLHPDVPKGHGKPIRKYLLPFSLANSLSDVLSWRRLNFVVGSAITSAMSISVGLQIGFVALAFFLTLSAFLPRVGQP